VKLSVPSNWDDALLDALEGLPVEDVYGQVDSSPSGGGRPGYIQDRVAPRTAAAHIRAARDRGLGFVYLMNAPCLDNAEFEGRFRDQLLDHLRWAHDAGATGVVVSIPLLAEAIKRALPRLWVKVSVIAHVGTVARAKAWEELGVDEITLDFNANRQLRRLEAIRRAVGCELSLLVNDLCLLDCPHRHYHYNLSGHASQAGHRSDGFVIDYCFLRCHTKKLQRPSVLLESPWIRPEDVGTYQALGFERFKLAGRTKPTPQIARAARAYAEQHYQGNLLDILEATSRDTSTIGFTAIRALTERVPGLVGRGVKARSKLGALLKGGSGSHFEALLARVPAQARGELIAAYVQLMQLSDAVVIDNAALDGFLEGLTARSCEGGCHDCSHCEGFAERAIRVDSARAEAAVAALEAVLEGVISGRSLPG
jgi:collagenase-like PrtC family protease